MPKNTARSRKFRTVYWLDHASKSEWMTLEEVKKWVEVNRKPCVTHGEIIFEDKDVIVLTDGNDGAESFGNVTLIYKKLIVKKLKRGEKNE